MTGKHAKIMVVDDDPGMLSTVKAILEDAGYEVFGVEDGHKAINLASHQSFDLVFMDISLPGIDGVEAYRQIKLVSPGIPVIMMTGFSVEDLVSQAFNEGAYTVLYKPFDVKRLLAAVQDVLDAPWVLVDNYEQENRELIKLKFEDFGYQLAVATDGNQAVAHLESRRYDVILMDVGIPGRDGFGACQRIVKADPSAKVIFMTPHEVNQCVRQALMAGAFSLLSKPVDSDHLFALVGSLVGVSEDSAL